MASLPKEVSAFSQGPGALLHTEATFPAFDQVEGFLGAVHAKPPAVVQAPASREVFAIPIPLCDGVVGEVYTASVMVQRVKAAAEQQVQRRAPVAPHDRWTSVALIAPSDTRICAHVSFIDRPP